MKGSYPHIVRDGVHGNIAFSDLEKKIIDHPLVQRLREISQLGFLKYVFPSSSHSRFEHSLGVMHLCGRVLDSIIFNQERLLERSPKGGGTEPLREAGKRVLPLLKDPRIAVRLRLAGLLHDLGHGPYSHASEYLTRRIPPRKLLENPALPSWLKETFTKKLRLGFEINHEWMTQVMAVELFSDLPGAPDGLLRDVLAILDPEIAPAAASILRKENLSAILHDLISYEIDADRMDYLLRDSRSAGVHYGLFDLERLLASLLVTWDKTQGRPQLAIHESGLHAFEDYLVSRYQMYLQVYTHKTNTSFETQLDLICRDLDFDYPLDAKRFIRLTDSTFPGELRAAVGILSGGGKKKRLSLLTSLFEGRKPWKMIFQWVSFRNGKSSRKAYGKMKSLLGQSAFESDVTFFESERSLSKLRPLPEGAFSSPEDSGLRLVQKDTLGQRLVISELRSHSYILDAFRKKIAIFRIYGRPEKAAELRSLLLKRFGPIF